jgi:hypothetical protein
VSLEREGYSRVAATTDPTSIPAMFTELRPDILKGDVALQATG